MSNTQKMVLTALMVALSFVIAIFMKLFPFFTMPNGGSISLSMLPIFFLAYALGPKYGILGGLAYSIINFAFDGYAFHWASLFFDYILAFGCLGLVGLVSRQVRDKNNLYYFFGSMLVVTTMRMLFHTISGMLAFEATFAESLAYNAPYCYISFGLCCIVGYIVKDRFFTMVRKQAKI